MSRGPLIAVGTLWIWATACGNGPPAPLSVTSPAEGPPAFQYGPLTGKYVGISQGALLTVNGEPVSEFDLSLRQTDETVNGLGWFPSLSCSTCGGPMAGTLRDGHLELSGNWADWSWGIYATLDTPDGSAFSGVFFPCGALDCLPVDGSVPISFHRVATDPGP
jgi:hypothetical protein